MTKIVGDGAEGRPAIAYVRVSTAAQGESGISLSTQKAVINASSEAWGYSVVDVFTDVASAREPNNMAKRLGLQGALRAADNRGAVDAARSSQKRGVCSDPSTGSFAQQTKRCLR